MTRVALAVIAHPKRTKLVEALELELAPEAVVWDKASQGPAFNHRQAWEWLAGEDADFGVVIEDDARPIQGFRAQALTAIENSPTSITSLYLGRNRPPQWQDSISRVIRQGAHYIMAPELLHGVCYAVESDLIGDILDATEGRPHFTEAISDWCREHNAKVAHTNPSLVDHNFDVPTLVPDQPTRYDESVAGSVPRDFAPPGWERRAWKVGARESWNGDLPVELPDPVSRQVLRGATHQGSCLVCPRTLAGTEEQVQNWANSHSSLHEGHITIMEGLGVP